MSIQKLWNMQCLLQQEKELKKKMSSGEGLKLKAEKKDILQQQGCLEEKNQNLKSRERLSKQKEGIYEEAREKFKMVENHLYSGTVSNPKELEGIQEQMLMLQQDIDLYEDDLLQTSVELDALRSSIDEEQSALERVKDTYRIKVKQYLGGKKDLEATVAQLKAELEELQRGIQPEILQIYNNATKEFGLWAISKVVNKTCSQCHLQVPALLLKEVRQGRGLVKCENCGRILYWE